MYPLEYVHRYSESWKDKLSDAIQQISLTIYIFHSLTLKLFNVQLFYFTHQKKMVVGTHPAQ